MQGNRMRVQSDRIHEGLQSSRIQKLEEYNQSMLEQIESIKLTMEKDSPKKFKEIWTAFERSLKQQEKLMTVSFAQSPPQTHRSKQNRSNTTKAIRRQRTIASENLDSMRHQKIVLGVQSVTGDMLTQRDEVDIEQP
jgi:hypothetical protein